MTPLHCPAEPAIDLAPGTLGEWEMPAAQLSCGRAVSSGICVIGGAAQTLTCLPNHKVKVQKGIRWLVYFGDGAVFGEAHRPSNQVLMSSRE